MENIIFTGSVSGICRSSQGCRQTFLGTETWAILLAGSSSQQRRTKLALQTMGLQFNVTYGLQSMK